MKFIHLRDMKIKYKLLAALIPLAVFIFAGTIYLVYTQTDKNISQMAKENAEHIAEKGAGQVRNEIIEKLQLARDLSTIFEGYELFAPEFRRNRISGIIKRITEEHPDVIGIWTIWEPNVLEGNDAGNIGKPGNDPVTGRFVPYWVNDNGKTKLQQCEDYMAENGYYLTSLRSKKEYITDPFMYNINGNNVLMVTLTVPILLNDKPVGVVGIDLPMNAVQSVVEKIKPYEESYAMLLSNTGTFVAHQSDKVLGKRIGIIDNHPKKDEILSNIASGKAFELDKKSISTGISSEIFYRPLQFSKDIAPWSFGISIPMDLILAKNRAIMWSMIIISAIALLIISAIVFIMSIYIAKPITQAVNVANSLASGNMNIKIASKNKDETGIMLNALEKMGINIKSVIDDINLLAENTTNGNLSYRVDANKYQGEYKELVKGVNGTIDAVVTPMKGAIIQLEKFSNGIIPEISTAERKGELANLKNSLNKLNNTFTALKGDVDYILKGIKNGNVQDTRADASKHNGIYREIISGFNQTLDIISDPLSEMFDVLENLSQGKLDIRMKGTYVGNLEVLKQNLNTTIDSLPLAEIMKVMEAMADGNLTVKMTKEYKGENLQIKEAVNATLDSLNEILGNVKSTVDEVTRASMQVSDTSTALSQGATEQAASLEEITSSMNEIGSQTRLNAENSNVANNLANNAKNAAEKGNTEMVQLIDAMNEINSSSQNISKIIKVIDEIAFQTNLLALNAAVEAARAGRHGKGFAVVAEEVRNLAARSATAAKETSEMIESSIKTVNLGSELVNKTGEALNNIKSEAVKVADIIGEITTSSNEQAQGIAQINEGLSQIDRVTQTNTASAEESASAAEELSGQASQLRELVDRFKLTGHSNSISKPSYGRTMSKGNKSLPSRHSATPMKEDDFFDLVDNHNYSSSPKRDLNPRDVIKLDEDDFDRY